MLPEPWRIELFGGLRAHLGDQTVTRFATQKTAALLAYLVFYCTRTHSREALADLLWPDSDPESSRHNLRQALASLRRVLEPPGVPAGSILLADRTCVKIDARSITTDVTEFEAALKIASQRENPLERVERLQFAVSLYRGELLPELYDDWVLVERDRLADAHLGALRQLARAYEEAGDIDRAVETAKRAIALNPLEEEAHRDLIRFYVAAGRAEAAEQQYHRLERVLVEELGESPSPERRGLLARTDDRPQTTNHRRHPAAPPRANRLPAPFTRFFGRHEETERLCAMLAPHASRLVTLTGPGGSGKTRLAVEVAKTLATAFDGRADFVPLAGLTDARLIPGAIADALGLLRSRDSEPMAQLIEHLDAAPSLLVLDNFEQVVEEGAPVVRRLLEATLNLTCLVTSRQRLELEGEREFPLSPLPTPSKPGTPERLMEFASVQLFVDRAQAVRPDFQVTPRNSAALATLCEQLEGIPLAIELAAARAQALTPEQMLDQLKDRFGFLVSRRRDAVERHRTLRSAIDWSYQLLSPDLRDLFAGLSVFVGGWTLDAASDVCGPSDALESMEQLRERSLILTEESSGEMRYRLLEALREFGSEQLTVEERAKRKRCHANYFLRLAEQAETGLLGPEQQSWLERLETEHDNLRAAIRGSLDNGEIERALRICAALTPFWIVRGYFSEGRRWLREALEGGTDVAAEIRARALNAAGSLAFHQGDFLAARMCLHEGMAIWRSLDDKRGIAISLGQLSAIARDQSDLKQARALAEEALALRREVGEEQGIAYALFNVGSAACCQGDAATGRALFEESLTILRRFGDKRGIALLLSNLGTAMCDLGDYTTGEALYRESLEIRHEIGDRSGIGYTLTDLAWVAHHQGDDLAARALQEESLAIRRELGDRASTARVLPFLALYCRCLHDNKAASTHYFEGLALLKESNDANTIAYALDGISRLLRTAHAGKKGDREAARLLAAASVMRKNRHVPLSGEDQAERDRFLGEIRDALGDEAFDKVYEEGAALTGEEVVEEALRMLSQ